MALKLVKWIWTIIAIDYFTAFCRRVKCLKQCTQNSENEFSGKKPKTITENQSLAQSAMHH